MSRRRWSRLRLLAPALLWAPALLLLSPLLAPGPGARLLAQTQPADDTKPDSDKPDTDKSTDKADKVPAKLALVEPVAYRVYQRDRSNRADIPIAFNTEATIVNLSFITTGPMMGGSPSLPLGSPSPNDGRVARVPVGGPYTINVTARARDAAPSVPQTTFQVGPIYVGDLWVLSGQSNMEGLGNLEDVTPPSERVTLLGMDGHWRRAEEPLHWLIDSPDPVHSGDPDTRAERAARQHKSRVKGAGLGLPFGVVLASTTGVPIGLIATAHGGTSMKRWDPELKGEEGKSLYGSMLGQVKRAGGRVRGVLWYQGESDATPEAAKEYPKAFAGFINSVRDDFQDLDLPFYLVQIGRVIRAGDPASWNAVQDAQRRIPDRMANTAVVASIDLELDDGIHIATPGLKRLGTRLARIAQRELYGQAGATTPTFDQVNRRGDRMLVVKFKGVNRMPGAPSSSPSPSFAGMGNTPGPAFGPSGFQPASAVLTSPSIAPSAGQPLAGLQPARHIAGFSIRKDDGSEIPLIYDAAVGPSQDTVILKLNGKVPEGANLWYGYGFDPYCNLIDPLDMAVPVFGPIPLDDVE